MLNQPTSPPTLAGGIPFLGHAVEFIKDPIKILNKGYLEKGKIFRLKLATKEAVVMLGPENNKFFFEQTDKLLSIREGYSFFAKMFSKEFYFMGDLESYKNQRDIILPCFHQQQMHSYVDVMVYETALFMKKLKNEGEFNLTTEFGKLVMNIAAHSFLGNDFRNKMGEDVFDDFRDFSKGMDPVLPLWLPLPHLIKSRKAKNKLHKNILVLINERRLHPLSPPDFFQNLVESVYKTGEKVSDEIIIHLILLLSWAGHETTAGHISWALIDLLQNESYLSNVIEEQKEVFKHKTHFEMHEINQLKLLECGIKETERLHPVAYILMRLAKETFQLQGYEIPKGTIVFAAPSISHQLPEVFPLPKKYDPFRFSNASDLPHHSLIGFGGGTHRCTGVNFAYLEMKLVLSILLQQYEFKLIDKNIKPIAGSVTKWPETPCRVSYKKRTDANLMHLVASEFNLAAGAIQKEKEENLKKNKCPFH